MSRWNVAAPLTISVIVTQLEVIWAAGSDRLQQVRLAGLLRQAVRREARELCIPLSEYTYELELVHAVLSA